MVRVLLYASGNMRSKDKKIRNITTASIFIFALAVVALAILASRFLVNHVRQEVAADKASTCPRTYENDFFQFEHSCDVSVLTANNGTDIKIVEFTHQGANEQYLLVKTLTESELKDQFGRYGGSFSNCDSGDGFTRWKITVPSIDGISHEACLQGEHSGTTLFIRSNQSHVDYVVIGQEGGSLDDVIPTLKMK